jgi:glycopeptide antibiotics resistance protein
VTVSALAVAFVVSVAVELLQVLTPDRTTQVADVWRNTLGCGLAALPAFWLARRRG